jgi:ankyrin repeat protein
MDLSDFLKKKATPEEDDDFIRAAMRNGVSYAWESLHRHHMDINVTDRSGRTALMWASRFGRIETVKLLLENGAHVNATDNDGNTALMLASRYVNVVELLLEYGAILNAKDKDGRTAKSYANRHTEIVELLVTHRATL